MATLYKGQIKEEILKRFQNMGYNIDCKILKACDYGVPQMRKRLIFMGIRKDLGEPSFPEVQFGPGTNRPYRTCRDAISDLPTRKIELGTNEDVYSQEAVTEYQKMMRKNCSDGKDAITYEYVPGPFMRVYVKALKNSRTDNIKPFLLIIEEINRANVAAVFGDIFQLLDRGDNYVSEYPIQASEDIKKHLADELKVDPSEVSKIRIPDNMFIWATMNSADQGVFPMDTAFKRRWDFTYLGIDDNDQNLQGKYVYLADNKSQKVEWNKLRKAINNFLAKEKINEDKQLGPYFISKSIVVPQSGDEIDRDKFINTFKNKVIMYLFEDAAKQKRAKLFEGCFQNSSRYSEICKEFEAKGVGIFNQDIQLDCEVEDMRLLKQPVLDHRLLHRGRKAVTDRKMTNGKRLPNISA